MVVGQSRTQGDLGHNGEDKRRFDQSEEAGRNVLEGHSQDRGPDKEVPAHWRQEGYGCNPEEHTDVGRRTLRNKK